MKYDVKCLKCESSTEINKPMSQSIEEVECPMCGKKSLTVVHLAAPPTIFKGHGWFRKG